MLSYLVGASDPDESAIRAKLTAEAAARKDVAAFGLADLLNATASLPAPSLDALLDALLAAASAAPADADPPPPTAAAPPPATPSSTNATPLTVAVRPEGGGGEGGADGGSSSPTRPLSPSRLAGRARDSSRRREALALQLLSIVAVRNAHRFSHVWARTRPALEAALSDAPPLVRSAVVALMRIALRAPTAAAASANATADASSGMLDTLLPSLAPVSQLHGVLTPVTADAAAKALEALCAPPADGGAPIGAIEHESSWRILLALTAAPDILSSPPAAASALAAVRHLVVAPRGLGAGVPAGCFASAVSSLLTHATSEATPPEHALRAIEILSEMHACLKAVSATIADGSAPAAALPPPPAAVDLASPALAPHAPWLRVWLPWLRSLASLTVASRSAVRDGAVVTLQRALLQAEPPVDAAAAAPPISAAFEGVVFPLLADLLQRAVGGAPRHPPHLP